MKYSRAYIESFGYELPERVVTSDEIEARLTPLYERLKLPHGRLKLMTGIRERRLWSPDVKPSAVAARAAEQALAASAIKRDQIGCLIHTSVCRDCLEPATSTIVHHILGLPPEAINFDLSNACLGMLNGILDVANRIELGQIKAGIVVAGENGGPLFEATMHHLLTDTSITRKSFKDSFASLTIGAGAAAIIVADKDLAPQGHRLVAAVARADTSGNDLCRGDMDMGMGAGSRPLMRTGSEELMIKGCALAGATWAEAKKELGWSNEQVLRCFSHQVGSAHTRLLYETMGVDRAKDFSTYEFLGNMGTVSWPITMMMACEKGLVQRGDKVMLLGIGSGINCVMAGVEW
ncbi:MAG: 3-oxoacyl-ACP synthase III [Candidatus Sumerlaeota bacterium]|nr:3-oxoacyl-ACP synthase III [Candidatus Sumerlaeota bacterium]